MASKYVKGRWYKCVNSQVGDWFALCDREGNDRMSYSIAVMHSGLFRKTKSVFPAHPKLNFVEVSPNEALKKVDARNLSREQLLLIHEVFFPKDVSFYWLDKPGITSILTSIGETDFNQENTEAFVLAIGLDDWRGHGLTFQKQGDDVQWATIITHPAYGDQDFRYDGSKHNGLHADEAGSFCAAPVRSHVKGRWYKSDSGDYWRCSETNVAGWWYDEYFSRGIRLLGNNYIPHLLASFIEVSPNEVLQSIKTEGLSPEQLKEIAEVFFVDGCRVGDYEVRQRGCPFEVLVSTSRKNHLVYGIGVSLYYGNTWATIISHPAYGDQDLREYGKVKVGGGNDRPYGMIFLTSRICGKSKLLKEFDELWKDTKLSKMFVPIEIKWDEPSAKEDQPKRKISELEEGCGVYCDTDEEVYGVLRLIDDSGSRFRRCGRHIFMKCDYVTIDSPKEVYHASDFLPKSFYSGVGVPIEMKDEALVEDGKRTIKDAWENMSREASKLKFERQSQVTESAVFNHVEEDTFWNPLKLPTQIDEGRMRFPNERLFMTQDGFMVPSSMWNSMNPFTIKDGNVYSHYAYSEEPDRTHDYYAYERNAKRAIEGPVATKEHAIGASEAKPHKLIQSLNHGIFPGFTMFIHRFTFDELMIELSGEWKAGIENDRDFIEKTEYAAMHRTIKRGDRDVDLYYIYIKDFNFSDYAFCKLAHKCLHITNFFLMDVLDRNREFEAEAYFHTHIMSQAIKHLRG